MPTAAEINSAITTAVKGTLIGTEGWEKTDAGEVTAWTDDYSDIIGAMLRKKLGR